MLTMTQQHNIRKKYFEEGKNIAQIARETGHDRKTVRVIINKDDWNEERHEESVKEYPKLEPYKAEIDSWLLADKKAKRKQRHTAKRVYDRLAESHGDGFNCCYRTVAGYVAKRKKEIFGKETGYLPLEHIPGEAQADFGTAEFYDQGRLFEGKYLNLSFPNSNKGYLQLFKGENQECLFEGLIRIFEHIGGVPQRIWFDNASTIVTQILQGGERKLTDSFLRFMEHYRFSASFCNPNAGHEKGSVEGKVGYHRRNMLVPVPEFDNLATYNQSLLESCDRDADREHYRKGDLIEDLFAEDKAALLELPTIALDVSRYIPVKTNGYGRFFLHNGLHEYSTSPKYAESQISVRVTANEVIPLDESHREIVRHERLYGESKQQSMKWLPYLTQLSRKPGALKYTGIYQILPNPVRNYLDKCSKTDKGKVLRAIAQLTEHSGFERAVGAVEKALQYDAVDVDSLVNIHRHMYGNVVDMPPAQLSGDIPRLPRVSPDLSAYDVGLGKAVLNLAEK
jgi:transposase